MTPWLLFLALTTSPIDTLNTDALSSQQLDPITSFERGIEYASGAFDDYGETSSQSYQIALDLFLSAAEHGLPTAQFNAALILEKGLAGTSDPANAVHFYKLAARQGHTGSQTNLANLYQFGNGVPLSKRIALEWYQKSIEHGDPVAMFNAAIIYHDQEQYKDAFELFKLAAQQGDARAQFNLYRYYQSAIIETAENQDEESMFWLIQSVEQDFAPALLAIAQHEIENNNQVPSWAIDYAKRSADLGYAPAALFLSEISAKSEQIFWLVEALALGNKTAEERLSERVKGLDEIALAGKVIHSEPNITSQIIAIKDVDAPAFIVSESAQWTLVASPENIVIGYIRRKNQPSSDSYTISQPSPSSNFYSITTPERFVRRGPVNLRAGATTSEPVKATLENGMAVNIIRFIDSLWVEVEVPELNKRGFMIARVLENN